MQNKNQKGVTRTTPIQISTERFEFAHGKKPRGRGNWWFIVEQIASGQVCESVISGGNSNTTFSQACSAIRTHVEEHIIRCGGTVRKIHVAS